MLSVSVAHLRHAVGLITQNMSNWWAGKSIKVLDINCTTTITTSANRLQQQQQQYFNDDDDDDVETPAKQVQATGTGSAMSIMLVDAQTNNGGISGTQFHKQQQSTTSKTATTVMNPRTRKPNMIGNVAENQKKVWATQA